MREPKKKFYYPIGLVSLILLPTFCLWHLYNHNAFKRDRVMEINWWSNFENELIPFNIHPERVFVDFHITGNDKVDKITFDFSQIEIRKLIATKDSIKGVHFIFTDASKYWTLIKAMDICFVEKAKCFVPNGNDLWVFNYTSKPRIQMDYLPMPCGGTGPMNCVPYLESTKEIAEKVKEKRKYVIETIKYYSISLLLFIIMIFLAIKQIMRNYRTNIKMKRIFTTGILIFATSLASGQNTNDSLKIPFNCSCKIDTFNGQKIYTIVEKMPEYATGASSMMKLLRENINFTNQDEIQSSVYLSFVIDTSGNVRNKCVLKPYHSNYLTKIEKSALIALDKMETWTPGEQNGKKVPVKFNLPIRIEMR